MLCNFYFAFYKLINYNHPEKMNNLSKPIKIVLGILTIIPLIYIPIFMVYFFTVFLQAAPDNQFPREFYSFFLLHLIVILIDMAVLVAFILDLIHTERIAENKKTLWALFLLFGGGL